MAQGWTGGGMSVFTVCVAGAESTGKSWLAGKLATHFGIVVVPEYAREYCAVHGNDLTLEQLHHIAEQQDAAIRGAMADDEATKSSVVIADTDAIVTSVWAQFSLGENPASFGDGFVEADLVLVMENDLPWEDDGVRCQSSQTARDRFRRLLTAELDRRHMPWVGIAGAGERRLANALEAIEACRAAR